MVSYSYCDNKPSPVCALVSTLNMFCRKIKINENENDITLSKVVKLAGEGSVICFKKDY